MCIHTSSGLSAPIHVSRLKLIFKSLETYSLLQKFSWGKGTVLLPVCDYFLLDAWTTSHKVKEIQEHKCRGGCSQVSCTKKCVFTVFRFYPHLAELHHLQNHRRAPTDLTIRRKAAALVHRQERWSLTSKKWCVILNTITLSLCVHSGAVENPEETSYLYWHAMLPEECARLQADSSNHLTDCCSNTPVPLLLLLVFHNTPMLTTAYPLTHQSHNSHDGSAITHTQNFSTTGLKQLLNFN